MDWLECIRYLRKVNKIGSVEGSCQRISSLKFLKETLAKMTQ